MIFSLHICCEHGLSRVIIVLEMKKFIISIIVVVSMFGLVSNALAEQEVELTQEDQDRFDTFVQAAVDHYSARRYEEAIEAFEKAFEIYPEPELIYNIARCQERLTKREEAVASYERFISMRGTTGDLRTRALANLTALRKEIAAFKAAEEAKEESDRADSTSSEGGDSDDTEQYTEESDEPMGPLSIVGWSLVGVGGVSIITGSIFGGVALSQKSDFEDADFDEDRIEYRDDFERNALVFDVVFFSGIGLAVAGAALLIVDAVEHRSDEVAPGEDADAKSKAESSKLSLAPSFVLEPGSLAVGLVGSF
jgi:tetratricopeptide (TPR) repeat protein